MAHSCISCLRLQAPRSINIHTPQCAFLTSAQRTRLAVRAMSTQAPKKQNRLPASFYRGGTSKAVMFNTVDLPADREAWAPIFRGVIGSPDPNGRQLDGLGGGVSSTSKVCVVGPSTHPDADVDYTFVAMGVKTEEVDYSSNCGNMTSAVGPFAVDKGLVEVVEEGEQVVRIHNTNTKKIIHSTFPVVDWEPAADGSFAIDGVAGTAAKIQLAFINPTGSKTGKLLPTGNVTDTFSGVEATCIDVGNPCVFIAASSLSTLDPPVLGTILPEESEAHATLLPTLDNIRRKASVAMGLSKDEASAAPAIPKIAMLSSPSTHKILSGDMINTDEVDLVVRAISVGQPHRAVPITVAMAIAAAANLEGSTVQKCLIQGKERVDKDGITLGHSSGKIVVGADFGQDGNVLNAIVYRTARRLMEGVAFWK